MPWALIKSAANMLSRPPEKTHIAFMASQNIRNLPQVQGFPLEAGFRVWEPDGTGVWDEMESRFWQD